MSKVLTYSPKLNANTFLNYTERTVHTEHGKMYRVTTESGHSIKVTDDHSLATVGINDFFAPIPPAESLHMPVPVISFIDYESELTAPRESDIERLAEIIVDDTRFYAEEFMLSVPVSLLYPYVFCSLDRLNWECHVRNEREADILKVILARLGILYDFEGLYFFCDINDLGYVPQDGILISRATARDTNVYKRMPYTWSLVEEVEEVKREPVTYDFTVPEYPLFVGNSILVYDTMQVHVPVTEEARQEALNNMLPSKNLFSARTLDPMMLPQQESVYGMYEASTPSKEKMIKSDSASQLKMDIEHDKIKPNHPVLFKGHATTAGLAVANNVLPEELREYNAVWDKKLFSKILTKVGKADPSKYAVIADELKELGALYAYKLGCSFKTSDFDLKDLKSVRDANFKDVDKQLKSIDSSKNSEEDKYTQKVKVLRSAQALNQSLTAQQKDNTFQKWAYSGARGSASQVMQIIASPTIVADPRDRVVPIPIKTGYNEGLSSADYWVSSYGTRKGTVSAKLSVAPGGALAKEIIGNVLDIVITKHDCGTKEGITLPVNAAHRKDIVDRYEAGTNKFVDDVFYDNLVKAKAESIVVRSPIKCHAQHGVCQLCYGKNEKGLLPEIGENVGVVAAQSVTEPLTQMGLSSKHTAGTAAAESIGLNTIKQFFTMPNTFAGAALIVENTGEITRIEPGVAGGTDIYVGKKRYHAAPGRTVKAKVGDHVNAGDIITDGIPNLKRIVPHKGIDVGRETFVDSASDLYQRAGAPSVRKNFETIARGIVNHVKIDNPGDYDHLLEGDVVDYNHIRAEIAQNKAKPENKSMVHPTFTPIQAGTTYAPQFKTDWLANFGFKYLKQNMIENAATGATSELHSYHPIAGYAAGAEFGKGKDGRY